MLCCVFVSSHHAKRKSILSESDLKTVFVLSVSHFCSLADRKAFEKALQSKRMEKICICFELLKFVIEGSFLEKFIKPFKHSQAYCSIMKRKFIVSRFFYNRFDELHFIKLCSNIAESLEEIVFDSVMSFFFAKMFLSLYVFIIPIFGNHSKHLLTILLFRLPQQMKNSPHWLASHKTERRRERERERERERSFRTLYRVFLCKSKQKQDSNMS